METNSSIEMLNIAHLILLTFGFLLLFTIWINDRKRAKQMDTFSSPILFMAFAVLMWISIELTRFLFENTMNNGNQDQVHQKWLFVSIFSAFNNTFILAALPFFKELFDSKKQKIFSLIKMGHWTTMVFTINTLVILLYIVGWMLKIDLGSSFIPFFDHVYSFLAISLFLVGSILALKQSKAIGTLGVVLLMLISVVLILIQFVIFPLFSFSQGYRFISLFAFHVIIIILMLLAVITIVNLRLQRLLELKNEDIKKQNDALQSELSAINQHKGEADTKNQDSFAMSRYLKFYKKEKSLAIELTMLEKGIVKFPIYCSVINREYKDLLLFAIYKKTNSAIKSYGGAHSSFGDIYKAIFDIRKRLINKHLDDAGLETLHANELIVQPIKGSGIYELDCVENNIEIDVEGLSEVNELKILLRMLS